MPPKPAGDPELFLGLDVGSISVKAALIDTEGRLRENFYLRHQGRPFAVLEKALGEMTRRLPPEAIAAVAATGSGSGELAVILEAEPLGEIMALTLAAETCPQAASLVDIGGEDTKVLWFGRENGRSTLSDFAMNALCAAGTGSFLDQQAHRLGYDLEEFGRLALQSRVPPRVAGRCSVFAKSDMIHLQQSAVPDFEIIYGLCLALARGLKSGLAKGRELPSPILFTGGAAANPGLRRAMSEVMALAVDQLIVPETHFVFGALGAALHARRAGRGRLNLKALSAFAAQGSRPPERQERLRPPAGRRETADFDWSQAPPGLEVYLGVDVGSVSTNAVLLTPEGRLVLRRYLPTAGRPLKAIAAALESFPPQALAKARILGVCTTGSGRYLSADYLGADLTVNEITAQAAAAAALDPKVDTIFEIGGQDSKYISLADGVIVDFMMNKACAAGTGSFLEEQAEKLGLKIKDEFAAAALAAESPARLGERCTVFMESDLVHHQHKGVAVGDLAAGLCYGIADNYLGRVVENRPIGERIFFQGGTAFNQGVQAAFEARLNKTVIVPDDADVTGAIGAALIARDRRDWEDSRFVGFDTGRRPYEVKSFECRDCDNRCEIRQVTVAGGSPLFYGSRCGRFDEAAGKGAPAVSKWPDLFEYRADLAFNAPEAQALLARGETAGRRTMGLMRSMFLSELGPFWSVFWARLGFLPVWSRPTDKGVIHQGCETAGAEFCFPIKAAHGHLADLAGRGLDHIFLPSIVNLPPGESGRSPDSAACPYVQALPYVATAALKLAPPQLVGGPVFFGEGEATLLDSLTALARPLGLGRPEIKTAMFQALLAQDLFGRRLREKGREILAALRPGDRALVVVARPYNGFDPGLNLRLNRKLADLGVLGLPMDFLPLDEEQGEALSHYWRYGQKITAAADFIARDGRLEALYISNFGCGPDSFILHFFRHQLNGRPFLEIEIDEHASDVGAVTRLEAFLDSLRNRPAPPPKAPPAPLALTRAPRPGKTIYFPHMCDHVLAGAAVFRQAGLMAEVLPPSDRRTVELGRGLTSGKECYPLILTAGDFAKLAERPGFEPGRSSIFMPSAFGPCRFGQYGRYLSLTLRRLGLEKTDVVSLDQTGGMYKDLDGAGPQLARRLWRALAATDLLQKAWRQTRPRESAPGAADAAYRTALADLVAAVERDSDLRSVMKAARTRFEAAADPAVPAGSKPRVGLVGEIYVRHNDFANEDLARRLEALGAEVSAPPFAEWIFYLGFVQDMRAKRAGDWKRRLKGWAVGRLQKRDLEKLAKPWSGFFHQGTLEPPLGELIAQGERFLHRSFQGEAILSLGKGLEYFHGRAAGLVNIMPFTCMPGQVTGALTQSLREASRGLPCLNLSFDGQSQTNAQARLEAFMYQVKSFHESGKAGSGPKGH